MKNEEIEIKDLPENLKREVLDYTEFLLKKYNNKLTDKSKINNNIKKSFKFDWRGGLSKFKERTTSVELQHKMFMEITNIVLTKVNLKVNI